jgi:hypothetical protein
VLRNGVPRSPRPHDVDGRAVIHEVVVADLPPRVTHVERPGCRGDLLRRAGEAEDALIECAV